MKTFIYILKCPISRKVRYVGKTINPTNRFNCHINSPKKNHKSHICSWIKSLKEKKYRPIMEIIDECYADWSEREQFWIAYYKSIGANLCNLTNGGEGMLGNIRSAETRKKISENSARQSSKKVYQFDLNGNFILAYKSATEAAKINNIEVWRITRCASGKQSKGGAFYWSYINCYMYKKIRSHNAKHILQYEKSGKLVNEFETIHKAESETGIIRQNISAACIGKAKSAGGFIWRHKIAI